jgi:hypothetical protein
MTPPVNVVILYGKEIDTVYKHAHINFMQGKTFRGDSKHPARPIDQILGYAGEIGFHKLIFDPNYFLQLFLKKEKKNHQSSYPGDRAMDVLDTPLDVKTSRPQNYPIIKESTFSNLNLVVHNDEYQNAAHDKWIYIQAFVDDKNIEDPKTKENILRVKRPEQIPVAISGWSYKYELMWNQCSNEKLKNRWTRSVSQLRSFPFPYSIFNNYLIPYVKDYQKIMKQIAERDKQVITLDKNIVQSWENLNLGEQ